jgi:hypothetical protein
LGTGGTTLLAGQGMRACRNYITRSSGDFAAERRK